MPLFAFATLSPLILILLAGLWGGVWVLAALLTLTLLTAALDALIHRTLPPGSGAEFPAADALSVLIALGGIALLALSVHALSGPALGPLEKAGLFAATGLYLGQVGNSNAHELIHRSNRWLHGLGMWAYIAVLFGHHTSAHVLVHHVRVATRADPSSARRGEGLYRFMARAWRGSFREGWAAESARLVRVGRPGWRHPYVLYLGGGMAMALAAILIGGGAGLLWYLSLAGFAQAQLLMSDYVQHYGLTRAPGRGGKPEPVGPRHSWNSPHVASSALMLNAPRHSDHHAHPQRPYPALSLPAATDAPRLPRALPVMACVALVPPVWRRVMHPRLAAWQAKP